MTEQEQNEAICERLLGWKRHDGVHAYPAQAWVTGDGQGAYTPTFTTWEGAGLIIDAFKANWPASREQLKTLGGALILGYLSEEEVRAAALEDVRSMK